MFVWALVAVAALGGCATQARVGPTDLDVLVGKPWTGTLTYKDYQSGMPTTIRSSLVVTRVAGRADAWDVRFGYSDEPRANRENVVVRGSDGTVFDDETVVERTVMEDGSVRIVTESDGEDDHRPARLRHVWVLGRHRSSLEKLVRYTGEAEFFERNVYRWEREGE